MNFLKVNHLVFFKILVFIFAVNSSANEQMLCEDSLPKHRYAVGTKYWPKHSVCQGGFGLCWLASSLNFIESHQQLEGQPLNFSFDYLAYHYFKAKALETFAKYAPVEQIFDTGGHSYDAWTLINQVGLIPHEVWQPRVSVAFTDKKEAGYFLSRLAVFIKLWVEKTNDRNQYPAEEIIDDFEKGLGEFLNHELGSYPEKFHYKDELVTPQEYMKKKLSPKTLSLVSAYTSTESSGSRAEKDDRFFEAIPINRMTTDSLLILLLRKSMVENHTPLIANMDWNTLTLGDDASFLDNVFSELNIAGLPQELKNQKLSSHGTTNILDLLDQGFLRAFGLNQHTQRLPGHVVLAVDAIVDESGQITHVVLQNSHGRGTGHQGFHFVHYDIFTRYVRSVLRLKD